MWKSQSEWEMTGINGESMSMVWPTLGSRMAKEQNRTMLVWCMLLSCVPLSVRLSRAGIVWKIMGWIEWDFGTEALLYLSYTVFLKIRVPSSTSSWNFVTKTGLTNILPPQVTGMLTYTPFIDIIFDITCMRSSTIRCVRSNAKVNKRGQFSHPLPSKTPEPISMSCQIYYYVPQGVDVQNLVGIDLAVTDLHMRKKHGLCVFLKLTYLSIYLSVCPFLRRGYRLQFWADFYA